MYSFNLRNIVYFTLGTVQMISVRDIADEWECLGACVWVYCACHSPYIRYAWIFSMCTFFFGVTIAATNISYSSTYTHNRIEFQTFYDCFFSSSTEWWLLGWLNTEIIIYIVQSNKLRYQAMIRYLHFFLAPSFWCHYIVYRTPTCMRPMVEFNSIKCWAATIKSKKKTNNGIEGIEILKKQIYYTYTEWVLCLMLMRNILHFNFFQPLMTLLIWIIVYLYFICTFHAKNSDSRFLRNFYGLLFVFLRRNVSVAHTQRIWRLFLF